MSKFLKLPASLRAIPSFLVWRLTHIDGEKKPRKLPSYVSGAKRSGTQGSDDDRAQLATFDKALEACERGDFSGLGFAVLPDLGVVALDFDDVVVEGRVDPRVLRVIAGTYAEYSPSGTGVRAFFLGNAASKKDLAGDPKTEVFGTNGFVTVTGNQLPEHEMCGWDDMVPMTSECREFLAERFGDMSTSAGTAIDLFATLKPTLGLDVERVREVLAKLPKDLSYDDWVKVGMATHHELGDDGWDVFLDWSRTSPKFTSEKYAHERWRSFGKYTGGQQLTFAWVLKISGESAVKESVDAVRGYRQMITDCADEFQLRTRVAGVISKDDRLQSIDRAMLAQVLQERLASLGAKVPIGEVRKLLAPPRRDRVDSLPPWAQGWCYVTADDKFLKVGTDEWCSKQGFDAQFNREMPRDENGNVTRAASVACLEDWGMPVVAKALYVPWGDEFFSHEGAQCVNRYRASSAPVAAESSDGAEEVVLRHLDLICDGRVEVRDWLVRWMAHNVQKPGVKIRWAPLIKGIEGDGKSVLGQLLAGAMGPGNVREVSPSVVQTDFTGWAEGACVGVLEELKLTGHNKFDVLNKLKPYVTNSTVEVHRKGRDTYNAHNTQNYIAFTNHADALPINDNDRRWFVIFTPWSDIHEFEKLVGNADAYFDRLHEVIHSSAPQLRRWLLDIDLGDFKPNSRAPFTEEKAEMISLSISDEEDTVRGIIEAGGVGVSADVLTVDGLSSLLKIAGLDLRTRSLSGLLNRIGLSKVPERIWWNGSTHRVWVRGNLRKDADSIKAALELTNNADLF